MSTKTKDLGAQIAQQRDRLQETVGALTDSIDTHEIADTLRAHASSGAAEISQTAQDERGRKGLVIGAIGALVGLVLLRRLLG